MKRVKTRFFVFVAFVAVASLFTVCNGGGSDELTALLTNDKNNDKDTDDAYAVYKEACEGDGATAISKDQDANSDGTVDWLQDLNFDGIPDWAEIDGVYKDEYDHNGNGVPNWDDPEYTYDLYVTDCGDTPKGPLPEGQDDNDDGIPDWRQDLDHDGIPDWYKEGGGGETPLETVATPVARPGAGSVADNTEIKLTTTTNGATIYYTTGEGTPTTPYLDEAKPKITPPAKLRAIAVLDGTTSEVLEADYTILTAGAESTVDLGTGKPKFAMRYVPPATSGFQYKDDNTDNKATITNGYWVGETEVTQELFYAVMGVNPSYFNGAGNTHDDNTTSVQAQWPVEQVNWYAAIAFCNKLSILDGKTPVYSVSGFNSDDDWTNLAYGSIPYALTPQSGSTYTLYNGTWDAAIVDDTADGYRLPTNMEWMWASMGGTEGGKGALSNVFADGYKKTYSGSQEGAGLTANVNDYAWYGDFSSATNGTHQVGKKYANELGLRDMSGNVQEWCWDWSDSGSYTGAKTDYKGPAYSYSTYIVNHVTRGGSYENTDSAIGVGYRASSIPAAKEKYIGLRVVQKQ
jgi:formylglycine-generating enzyme required for sulfatase activity